MAAGPRLRDRCRRVLLRPTRCREIRAAVIHDTYVARQGVEHDDVNVACLGAWVVGRRIAEDVVTAFLAAEFSTDPDCRRRVRQLADMELAAAEGLLRQATP